MPTSKGVTGKLVFDEADAFPRGGAKGETIEMKKKKKRKKTKTPNTVPSAPSDGHKRQDCLSLMDGMPNSESKLEMKKRKKRSQKLRIAEKRLDSKMYPTDENLFIIKQRRGKRR